MTEIMFKTSFLSTVFTRFAPFLSKLPREVIQKTFTPSTGLTSLVSLMGGAGVPHPASGTIKWV